MNIPYLTEKHLQHAIRREGLRLTIDGRTLAWNGTEYVVTMRDGQRFGVSGLRHKALERAFYFLMMPAGHDVQVIDALATAELR